MREKTAAPAGAGEQGLHAIDRNRAYLFLGALYFLTNFPSPALGLIDLPVSFFLKNRLHLDSHETAVFRLILGLPMIFGFVFGFVRDSWSPFGRGDKAHLVMFAGLTGLTYAAMTMLPPTYGVLLGGLMIATICFQMTLSVAGGLTTILGQDSAATGGLASISLIASYLPQALAFVIGGTLSQALNGGSADLAAHMIFLVAASLMLLLALTGLAGPVRVYQAGERARTHSNVSADLKRLARHWPIYPVMMIQLLWQFAPATGTVLQYHLTNTLHGTDAQWGQWQALFIGAFVPGLFLYGWLCRRIAFKWLLWSGLSLGIAQMVPLLFIHTVGAALMAAVLLGLLGALGQGALVDLLIRSSPRGLEGTTMMLFFACYWASYRGSDLFGTALYDRAGFTAPVIAAIIAYSLMLPLLLLVPTRIIAAKEGERLST